MFKNLAGAGWRLVPRGLRRWFVRMTHTRFVVSAGGIISDDQGRVLLLKHRFRPGSGWGMPGGFMKEGEQPDEALRRELMEEVGVELDQPVLLMTRAFVEPKQIEIVFRCRALSDVNKKTNLEIEEAGWFFPHELPPQLPKDQAQIIKSAFDDGAKMLD